MDWRLLTLDDSWCSFIQEDLRWKWTLLCNTTNLGDPDLHPGQWDYLLRYRRSYWKKLINRAVRLSVMKVHDEMNVVVHRQPLSLLQGHGTLACPPPHLPKPSAEGHFAFIACNKRCRTAAGEGAHMFTAHGIINELRYLFDGAACPACLREYHRRGNLLAHLRSQQRCQDQLRGRRIHCDPAPGIGSLANRHLAQAHNGLLPFQRGQGLLCDAGAPQPWRGEDPGFGVLLCDFVLFAESWSLLVQTVQCFKRIFIEQDADQCVLTYSAVHSFLDHIVQTTHRPLFEQARSDEIPVCHDRSYYETWIDQLLCETFSWHRSQASIARPFFRERIFLHAFSGRRRRIFGEGFRLRPGSCRRPCGVASPRMRRGHFGTMLLSRAGFLAGPPAMLRLVPSSGREMKHTHKRTPHVIRSRDDLWGYLSVSLREQLALTDGNLLLGFSVLLLYAILCGSSDGAGVLEHPSEPAQVDLASIWKLPLIRLLLTLPEVQLVPLAQGLLGAGSPKPTSLLSLRLPGLLHALHSHRVCKELPRATTIGADESGSFKTAALKEYPPAMCRAFAYAFMESTPEVESGSQSSTIPPDVKDRCTAMQCSVLRARPLRS